MKYTEAELRELAAALDSIRTAHNNVQKLGRKGTVQSLAEAARELIESSSHLLAISVKLASESCRRGE